MKKLADFIIEKRAWILFSILAITLFFAFKVNELQVYSKFADLLPQGHSFIKVYNDIRELFGGANTVTMIFQVREGDIFNIKTLGKVKHITEELEKIPGVDPYKILSLASNKLKDLRITAWGMESLSLMYPKLPENEEEMERLKNAIFSNEMYYGSYEIGRASCRERV